MKIGLDFDGVIADSHGLKPMLAAEMFGVKVDPALFRKSIVVGQGILTIEQYSEIQRKAFYEAHEIKPVVGVQQFVSEFRQQNEISVITSRSGKSLEIAIHWLQQNHINLPVHGVGYGVPKTSACQGLDVYIDDDLGILKPLVDVVSKLFLFSWPYNKAEEVPLNIARVWDYHQLRLAIIDEI